MSTTPFREYSWEDNILIGFQKCLLALVSPSTDAPRPSPSNAVKEHSLSPLEKKQSASLMRVNHAGEICAQALYLGQSWVARDPQLREIFKVAANEESDHLNWCAQRLVELEAHTSYLNPLWFAGSLFIGTLAGVFGDHWSLGFLAETENQVFRHLAKHLEELPLQDEKSRKIVVQMQIDESKHAATAMNLGGKILPYPIKIKMRYLAKLMTSITYYV